MVPDPAPRQAVVAQRPVRSLVRTNRRKSHLRFPAEGKIPEAATPGKRTTSDRTLQPGHLASGPWHSHVVTLEAPMSIDQARAAAVRATRWEQSQFLEHPDWRVTFCLANNRSLSGGLQERLACHEELAVRLALAMNPACTEDVQRDLYASSVLLVRRALAQNPKLPRDLQELLFASGDERVQFNLAGNPAVTGELADRLRAVRSPLVQSAIARHADDTAEQDEEISATVIDGLQPASSLEQPEDQAALSRAVA